MRTRRANGLKLHGGEGWIYRGGEWGRKENPAKTTTVATGFLPRTRRRWNARNGGNSTRDGRRAQMRVEGRRSVRVYMYMRADT